MHSFSGQQQLWWLWSKKAKELHLIVLYNITFKLTRALKDFSDFKPKPDNTERNRDTEMVQSLVPMDGWIQMEFYDSLITFLMKVDIELINKESTRYEY